MRMYDLIMKKRNGGAQQLVRGQIAKRSRGAPVRRAAHAAHVGLPWHGAAPFRQLVPKCSTNVRKIQIKNPPVVRAGGPGAGGMTAPKGERRRMFQRVGTNPLDFYLYISYSRNIIK